MSGTVVKNAIVLYAGVLLILYVLKPRVLFLEQSKRTREFGVGYNRDGEKRTLFSLPSLIPVVSVTCFGLSAIASGS